MFLFIELGDLYPTEGPIYEGLFCRMVVLQKGTLSLAKLFLELFLFCEAYWKTSRLQDFFMLEHKTWIASI